MKYWVEKWNLAASSPSVAPFLGDSEGEGPSCGHMFLSNRRMQGPSWHNLLRQYRMMEVRGCAKRDRPVKSDGCVRLRGQKIKGIEGLGVSILLHAMWNLKVLWKALYGPRSLSLQVNHGSLDKKSWNLCQFLFKKGFYLIFIFKSNYAVYLFSWPIPPNLILDQFRSLFFAPHPPPRGKAKSTLPTEAWKWPRKDALQN